MKLVARAGSYFGFREAGGTHLPDCGGGGVYIGGGEVHHGKVNAPGHLSLPRCKRSWCRAADLILFLY